MDLGGLHHVTAVTTEASENVALYTEILGLRLVKKTVNQDDVSAYHLFYGDELGRPGTDPVFRLLIPRLPSNTPLTSRVRSTCATTLSLSILYT